MTAVTRAFPAASTLATWWRQLHSLHPRALWVADLLLHRVDALVRVDHPCQADPLSLRVLSALEVAPNVDSLESHTGLPRQFLHQVLGRLRQEGLVLPHARQVSELGTQALATGSYARPGTERRTFHFRASATRPPRFLALRSPAGEPCLPGEGWTFDMALLAACLQQPHQWKTNNGFPLDVLRIDAPEPADWRQVAVDTPVRLSMALVGVGESEEVHGYAYSSENGALNLTQPALVLGAAAAEVFPELTTPTVDEVASAWREWCRAQACPEAEAFACRLEPDGNWARVAIPVEPAARLESMRDPAWLLVGKSEVRRAVRVEFERA